MFPRRFMGVVVAGFIALGVFMMVNANAQRDAWMQGYLLGRVSGGGSDAAASTLLPLVYGGYLGQGGPGGFAPFLFIGLAALAIFGVSRAMRAQAWRHHGGAWGQPGQLPPWAKPEQTPGSEDASRAQTPPWGHRPPWWGDAPPSTPVPQTETSESGPKPAAWV